MLDKVTTRVARLFIGVGNKISAAFGKTTHLRRTIRVARPPREVYAFWRDFERLGRIADDVVKVEVKDAKHSRWTVVGPLGLKLIWSAELVADEKARRISWRTIAPTDLPHAGQVHFRSLEGGRTTEIAVEVDYRMPLGPVGEAIAWVLRSQGPNGFVAKTAAQAKKALENMPQLHTATAPQVPQVLEEAADSAIGGVAAQPFVIGPEHKSRAARAADAKHLLDLAKGPPAPPTTTVPKKNGRQVGESGGLFVDRRARQRTQH